MYMYVCIYIYIHILHHTIAARPASIHDISTVATPTIYTVAHNCPTSTYFHWLRQGGRP